MSSSSRPMSSRVSRIAVSRSARCVSRASRRSRTSASSSAAKGLLAPSSLKRRRSAPSRARGGWLRVRGLGRRPASMAPCCQASIAASSASSSRPGRVSPSSGPACGAAHRSRPAAWRGRRDRSRRARRAGPRGRPRAGGAPPSRRPRSDGCAPRRHEAARARRRPAPPTARRCWRSSRARADRGLERRALAQPRPPGHRRARCRCARGQRRGPRLAS